jgi:hypothetical protein
MLFFATLALFFFMFKYAVGAEISLQWEYGADDPVDGFRFYVTTDDNTYDYSAPAATTDAAARETKITVPDIDGKITRYRIVARTYRGSRSSPDSNECEMVIDLAPVVAPKKLKCFLGEILD